MMFISAPVRKFPETKMKVMKIVFVPTIMTGLNDHQIGDVVRSH